MMSNNEGSMNRVACASCKHQRKRCQESCVMATHFPQRLTGEFQAVHKIFGIANVTKAIKAMGLAQQQEAIESFIWEAMMWDNDHVHGPYGEVKRLEERIRSLEEDRQQKEIVIKNLSQQVLLAWDNGVVNSSDDNGTLTNSDSSAMNVNNYVSVLEEEKGNGLMGSYIQGRGFIQDVSQNNFNYCNSSSFVQERQVRMMNQGREGILGQNNICSSSAVLTRRGERIGGFGDHHRVMQYAASRSSLVDYNTTSQQHVRVSNHNNILPDQPDQVNVEIRGGLNPKKNS